MGRRGPERAGREEEEEDTEEGVGAPRVRVNPFQIHTSFVPQGLPSFLANSPSLWGHGAEYEAPPPYYLFPKGKADERSTFPPWLIPWLLLSYTRSQVNQMLRLECINSTPPSHVVRNSHRCGSSLPPPSTLSLSLSLSTMRKHTSSFSAYPLFVNPHKGQEEWKQNAT